VQHFPGNALHKHLLCGDIVLCSERIFIADGFAFYSSRPRTAGDPSAVPSFPQGRIFTQIFRIAMRNARSILLNSIAKFSGSVSPARLANAFDCAGREGFSQYASVSAIGVCTGIGVLRRSKVQTERNHSNTPIADSK